MVITKYNSTKLKVLNFVLIILVLYVHSFYIEASDFPIASALQEITGNNGVARVCIPLFFCISGYLFYAGMLTVRECLPKIWKRCRTLLVPYVLWNIIFVLWYVVLQNIPAISGFVNSDMVTKVLGGGMLAGLKELILVPAGFHLWFVRDLILYVLLSPVLFYLCKYLKWFSPALLFLLTWFLDNYGGSWLSGIDYEVYRIDGIAFFAIGSCIAMWSSLESLKKTLTKPVVWACSFTYVINAAWQVFGEDFTIWYNSLTALCGCVMFWSIYDIVAPRLERTKFMATILQCTNYAFFIYLFHEPTFNIIKKIGLKLLGVHEWSLILLYLINPIIMCAVAICVAKVLQRYVPRGYSVLVGGR